jgi:hypothetical protein
MTGPTFHALAMIALLGGTVAACVMWGRPGKGPRILAGLGLGLLCIPAYVLFGMHKCDAGDPVLQALLGGGCLVALAVWIRTLVAANVLALAAVASGAGLVTHYNTLVHSAEVTGNPAISRSYLEAETLRRTSEQLARLGQGDPQRYPGGWLGETAFARKDPASPELRDLAIRQARYEGSPFWHTWFTGLYVKRTREVALWFPGGTISEGAGRLEWRECGR